MRIWGSKAKKAAGPWGPGGLWERKEGGVRGWKAKESETCFLILILGPKAGR